MTDAVELLRADQARIERLFARCRTDCAHADALCTELAIQLRLERELLLPAAREAGCDEDVLDEIELGHERVQDMLAQVLATRPGELLYEPRLAVLHEYAVRHLRQLREHVYPQVRAQRADGRRLGRLLAVRKDELRAVAEALREDMLAMSLTS